MDIKKRFSIWMFIFSCKNSCFESLKWTNLHLIENASIEADAWAKAWPQNLDKDISMKEFKNFHWVEAQGCSF